MNKDKPVDKIIEGNKAIAEFVGGKLKYYNLSNEPYYQMPNKQQWMPERLVYHTSWDWQNEAWVKINKWFNTLTGEDREEVKWLRTEYANAVHNGNLIHGHTILVNAINWYNQTKNK